MVINISRGGEPIPEKSNYNLPDCPSCGRTSESTDMKYNDLDSEGKLFECYRCSYCLHRFCVTYEDGDDTGYWWYDPQ